MFNRNCYSTSRSNLQFLHCSKLQCTIGSENRKHWIMLMNPSFYNQYKHIIRQLRSYKVYNTPTYYLNIKRTDITTNVLAKYLHPVSSFIFCKFQSILLWFQAKKHSATLEKLQRSSSQVEQSKLLDTNFPYLAFMEERTQKDIRSSICRSR